MKTPDADSGLRNPGRPEVIVRYQDVTPDELFNVARLVVSAEIAKIHTIEWTTQLLYNEPLYRGMNANWHGLFNEHAAVSEALREIIRQLDDLDAANNSLYTVFAVGAGIFGLVTIAMKKHPFILYSIAAGRISGHFPAMMTSTAGSTILALLSIFPKSLSPFTGCILCCRI
ncbi:Animal haem peroxidase [Nitrosomonas sp. Nm34]|nr:Animal haem peroxidase [Nitrosomonas sp. Nm34]